jgi:hypothetical protein
MGAAMFPLFSHDQAVETSAFEFICQAPRDAQKTKSVYSIVQLYNDCNYYTTISETKTVAFVNVSARRLWTDSA